MYLHQPYMSKAKLADKTLQRNIWQQIHLFIWDGIWEKELAYMSDTDLQSVEFTFSYLNPADSFSKEVWQSEQDSCPRCEAWLLVLALLKP